MQATVIEALSRVVYFSAFDEPRRAQLAERMIRQHYLPGETLFLEGDPTLGMWIIEHGRIKIFKLNPNGEEHVLRLLGDGEIKAKISITVNHATQKAKAAVEKAGGSISLIERKVIAADEEKRKKSAAKKVASGKKPAAKTEE